MSSLRRRCLALWFLPTLTWNHATAAPAARKDAQPACSLSIHLVALRLVSAAGAPITGASMRVWRVRTGQQLEGAGPMGGQGDFKLMEDGDLPDLVPEGEPFDVEFRRGDRVKRVRLRIGLDAMRCHVALQEGSARIVW